MNIKWIPQFRSMIKETLSTSGEPKVDTVDVLSSSSTDILVRGCMKPSWFARYTGSLDFLRKILLLKKYEQLFDLRRENQFCVKVLQLEFHSHIWLLSASPYFVKFVNYVDFLLICFCLCVSPSSIVPMPETFPKSWTQYRSLDMNIPSTSYSKRFNGTRCTKRLKSPTRLANCGMRPGCGLFGSLLSP